MKTAQKKIIKGSPRDQMLIRAIYRERGFNVCNQTAEVYFEDGCVYIDYSEALWMPQEEMQELCKEFKARRSRA